MYIPFIPTTTQVVAETKMTPCMLRLSERMLGGIWMYMISMEFQQVFILLAIQILMLGKLLEISIIVAELHLERL